jgi:hypothetical protein
MKSRPRLKLSVLRDIGWSEWDPIGLRELDGGWQDSKAADEYDGYLLNVAGRLQRDEPESDLVDYLIEIEAEHMGAGHTPTSRPRAVATVKAISEYVRSLA